LGKSELVGEKYESFSKLASLHDLQSNVLNKNQIEKLTKSTKGDHDIGLFTPSDGRVEPEFATRLLGLAAACSGVHVAEECAVRSIELTNKKVVAVVTENGRALADQVVLAGGAWSSLLLGTLGIHIPQLSIVSTVAHLSADNLKLNTNVSDGELAYFDRQDGGIGVSLCDRFIHPLGFDTFRHLKKYAGVIPKCFSMVDIHPFGERDYPGDWSTRSVFGNTTRSPFERKRILAPDPNAKTLKKIIQKFGIRSKNISNVQLINSWAGVIDLLPDFVPVIDRSKEIDGLWIATGFSGHGFGMGPVVGRILGDRMTGGSSGHDLSRFNLSRFSDGRSLEAGPTF